MAFLDALLSEARAAVSAAASLVEGFVGGGENVGCASGLMGPESILRGLLGGGALPGGLSVGEVVAVGDRVVRVVGLLGEGGFAYVYSAAPAASDPATPPSLALKRTVGPDRDRLAAAAREAASAIAAAGAPGILRLLAHGPDAGTPDRPPAYHLLTPLARGGSLDEAIASRREARLAAAGYRISGSGGRGAVPSARLAAAAGALPARAALSLLAQAADALAALHAVGLAHCDVKPQNLLVMEGGAFAAGGWCEEEEEEGGGEGASEDGRASSAADSLRASAAGSSRPASAAVAPQQRPARPPPPTLALTDFGSARPSPAPIPSRADAAALLDWAEGHTSPAYRPPELFDPPAGPSAALTPAVDVWGLGCTLYFLLAGGVSPFERAASGAGGSIPLAVLAGRVAWPDEGGGGARRSSSPARPRRVAAARALAEACLAADPAARPSAAEVAARARALAG